jgi:hypothetical protein
MALPEFIPSFPKIPHVLPIISLYKTISSPYKPTISPKFSGPRRRLFHQGLGLFAEAKLHTDLRLVAFSEAQGLAETGESGPWQPTMDILYVYKYIYIYYITVCII